MKFIVSIAFLMILVPLGANTDCCGRSYPFDVYINGQGERSILFIPGFACSGEVWDETKAMFEEDFTCYTLTMAGFAGVRPQPESTFTQWKDGIAKYIQENRIEKPVIIGHSMGGALALALAADFPELVDRIVVVDALPCLMALTNPSFKTMENPDCSAMISRMVSITDEHFLQMQKISVQRLVTDTSKQNLVLAWSLQSDRKTFAEMYCDFSNTDLRETVRHIQCPVLVLLEEPFRYVKQAVERQYQGLPDVDIQYANKGLHFIMYDDREWYMEQLSRFLVQK